MDLGIITGIFGGICSIIFCGYMSSKVSHKLNEGKLKFGITLSIIFYLCFLIVIGCLYFLLFTDIDNDRDFFPLIGIIIGFSLGAIFSFGEAYKVHGDFDGDSISFHTPWTGSKNEKWSDLVSVKFNATANWYTLTFNSGAKVRLSALLTGHGLVVDHVKSLGYSVK